MTTHRNNRAALPRGEQPPRRDRLVAGLPQAAAFLAGSLVEQRRRCGKEGCRCARGELHGPYAYLSVAGRMVYVPAVLGGAGPAPPGTSTGLQGALAGGRATHPGPPAPPGGG